MSEHLDALRVAVEQFAGAVYDTEEVGDTSIVTQALVVYELVTFDATGSPTRSIQYAIPTDNWSLSGGLGLIEAARCYLRRDALGTSKDDDDD